MKKTLCILFILLLGQSTISNSQSAKPNAPLTMRVDYYHTGDVSHEVFSLDQVVIEPLPWPGNPRRAVDTTNLGKYIFEVRDRSSNALIYSRGFASIYGEWETTDQARSMNRTFSESLRFPAPAKPVQVTMKKRDSENAFREIWSFTIDPENIFIKTSKPSPAGQAIVIEKNGDSADKVDLLILADGYTANERGKFEKDARRLAGVLFETEPFKSRRKDFNVWALFAASPESGVSMPSNKIHRRSAIGSTYDAFGSQRYILTFENKAFRDIASLAPYDVVEILVNSETYGGGGIFNLYGTVAADSLWAPYIFVHEFGHHLAGLADEYYTSDVAYTSPAVKVEPWEPNATALLNPKALKWGAMVEPGTPIPTPWNKDEYERYSREVQEQRRRLRQENRPEAEIDDVFKQERAREEKMFAEERYAGKVGAFEGANYEANGYYRPQANCIMFTRTDHFCRVCRRAIEDVIDLYTR